MIPMMNFDEPMEDAEISAWSQEVYEIGEALEILFLDKRSDRGPYAKHQDFLEKLAEESWEIAEMAYQTSGEHYIAELLLQRYSDESAALIKEDLFSQLVQEMYAIFKGN